MRFSTAIPIFVTVARVNADGARINRVAKSSKSGSAGSMDAGSWWGPAPSPATWGPAPTWSAPAPAPATWAATATWAAPAPAVDIDGCRAVWLPNVSTTTFSNDLCTLSGWWKANVAQKGAITTNNAIQSRTTNYVTAVGVGGDDAIPLTGNPGFQFLFSIPRITDVDAQNDNGDGGAQASTKDNYSVPGFIDDLTNDAVTNPLTGTGVSYCQCWSVVEKNCDPAITTLADDVTKETTILVSGTNHNLSDNFAEYSVVQAAIKKIAGHNDANNAATVTPVEVNKQSEASDIQNLLDNLPSKLNSCAVWATAQYDSN